MPAKSKKRRLLKKSRSHKLNFKAPWFVLLLLLLLGTLFVYLYRSFSQPARIAEIAGVQPFKQALEITDQNSAVILPPLISDGSFTFEAWIYPNQKIAIFFPNPVIIVGFKPHFPFRAMPILTKVRAVLLVGTGKNLVLVNFALLLLSPPTLGTT